MDDPAAGFDEAFASFAEVILGVTDVAGQLRDEEAGTNMWVEELTIETPVELDLVVRDGRCVGIGTAPPLYRVDVSVLPVFHTLRVRAVAAEGGR